MADWAEDSLTNLKGVVDVQPLVVMKKDLDFKSAECHIIATTTIEGRNISGRSLNSFKVYNI